MLCSSGANQLGRNSRWKRGLAYHRTEEMALCSASHGGNGILIIGRGLAYRKTEETDLLHSKRGLVDRDGCGVLQNEGNRHPTVETGVLFIGWVWCTAKRDSTRYCSSPPSTSSSLHGLLFIQRQRHRSLFIQTPCNAHCSSNRSASVSSSSEGIAPSG